MEPRIQYAQTADGVCIAFWTLGEGMPVVIMPRLPWALGQWPWKDPEARARLEQLAQGRMLICYDCRGAGLSQREVTDFSLDAYVLDLQAVVQRLALDRVALFGYMHTGPVAIAYATSHRERVSHLLLWHSYARNSDIARSPRARSLVSLMDTDWEVFIETAAHFALGWSAGDRGVQLVATLREDIQPEVLRADKGVVNDNGIGVTAANGGGKGVDPDPLSDIASPVEEFHKDYFSHVIISRYPLVTSTAFSKPTPEISSSVSSPE